MAGTVGRQGQNRIPFIEYAPLPLISTPRVLSAIKKKSPATLTFILQSLDLKEGFA